LAAFVIYRHAGATRSWLTRTVPFVTWGPIENAKSYPSERLAWQAIEALPPKHQAGTAVAAEDN
jgi:hypothetical protein